MRSPAARAIVKLWPEKHGLRTRIGTRTPGFKKAAVRLLVLLVFKKAARRFSSYFLKRDISILEISEHLHMRIGEVRMPYSYRQLHHAWLIGVAIAPSHHLSHRPSAAPAAVPALDVRLYFPSSSPAFLLNPANRPDTLSVT